MPILDQWTLDFVSNSLEQTERLGLRLGQLLQPFDLLCLSGDLGAGKTAMARGIGRGWGTTVRVTSPSFALINEYPRAGDGRILYHIDCYRLEGLQDAESVGLEDVLEGNGAVMIEWPERIESWIPPNHLWIELAHLTETRRQVTIEARGDRAKELMTQFKQSAFGV
jgi:tRNA threonylcarbamoyladenosine biosynthesis protein TsaE